MNFVGKFDAKLHVDGSGAHPDAHHHVDSVPVPAHAPSDAIIVPDADLLFNGDFKRSGVDLILSRDDHELVLQDYFKGEKRAALASPDGAHLTGDIVNALAGHVEYAQADGSAGAGKVIGHVTKLVGTATAIRNGVSIILNQGDNVEKGDVVQSGSGSTLGVTFIDGTVFGLSSNARMVLNEMVYDPNGSDNSSLISLVAGTISFVAGQTAKHGDMKIDTPVATMGIRGTAVLVEIDFDVPGQNGMPEAKFQVLIEPDGTTGSYILFDKNTLAPIAIVNKAGQRVNISNNNVSFQDSPLTPELQKLITDVFALKFTNANPQTFTHLTDTLIPQANVVARPIDGWGAAGRWSMWSSRRSFRSSVPSAPAPSPTPHINQPPVVTALDNSLTERAGVTGSSAADTTFGTISFADINLGDRPTAKATISSFTYQNAQHQDISAECAGTGGYPGAGEYPGGGGAGPGQHQQRHGDLDLQCPGHGFRLPRRRRYADADLYGGSRFELRQRQHRGFCAVHRHDHRHQRRSGHYHGTGKGRLRECRHHHDRSQSAAPGGPDDEHADIQRPRSDRYPYGFYGPDGDATLSGTGVTTLDMQALEAKFPRPMGVFESALSAAVTTDSSGTGAGTITWTLADISAYYADIVPAGETLTLTYTVTVKDSQGATSSQNVIVTITGSEPPAVVWVETTADALTDAAPGDWNGAHNWETGTVPTATDDVIIITNQLQGPTPFYPVTIKAGATASAHSVTMDDFDDLANTPGATAPELDIGRVLTPTDVANGVQNGTLTIGTDISLSADAILKVFGTLSVGTIATILGNSVLQNSGSITLGQGGEFGGSSSITNSGTIEIVSDTLNVEVAIANSGGTIQIDSGATLQLNGTAIDGGTINDFSSTGGGNIDVTVASKIAGTSATDANLNGNGTGTVTLDAALTLDYVKLDGITLENGATPPGLLTILDTVEVAGAVTLLNDTVTNTGATLQVDDGQTLKLSGTTINGGTINDFSSTGGGNIDVTVASKIAGTSATDANLNGNGTGTVTLDAALTLDYVKLDGITLENGATPPGLLTLKDTVEVAGAVTLLNDTVTNTGATLQVDDGQTLKLYGHHHQRRHHQRFQFDRRRQYRRHGRQQDRRHQRYRRQPQRQRHWHGDARCGADAGLRQARRHHPRERRDAAGPADHPGYGRGGRRGDAAQRHRDQHRRHAAGRRRPDADAVGHHHQRRHHQRFQSTGGGNIDVTGASKIAGTSATDANLNGNGTGTVTLDAALTLDYVKLDGITLENGATPRGLLTIKDTVEVAGAVTLLNDTVTNTGATLQVDDGVTLKLSGTTIDGGTINDLTPSGTGGMIDVTGNSEIDSGATLNNGAVTVESGVTLTLDNDTVTGTTFTDTASGATFSVNSGANLNFAGATVSGGLVNIGGTFNSTGVSAITNAAVTIATGGTVEATTGKLTISSVSISNAGLLEAKGGTLEIDGSSTPVAFLADNFAANSALNAGWTVVSSNPASSVQIVPGAGLEVTASALNGGSDLFSGTNLNAPVVLRSIDPALNWTIETKLDFSPTDNYQGAGILLATTTSPFTSTDQFNRIAERAFYPNGGGDIVEGAGGSDPYSSGSIYLEVTKTGDIYTTSFSSDGINWTVLGTETDATAYDEIGLFTIRQPWDNNTLVSSQGGNAGSGGRAERCRIVDHRCRRDAGARRGGRANHHLCRRHRQRNAAARQCTGLYRNDHRRVVDRRHLHDHRPGRHHNRQRRRDRFHGVRRRGRE